MEALHWRSAGFVACLWAIYTCSGCVALRGVAIARKRWAYLLIGTKGFVALTMGHLDMIRFLNFISHFVQFPWQNPWAFATDNAWADFPYPPPLLYLHTLAFWPFQALGYTIDFDSFPAIGVAIVRLPFLIIDTAMVFFLANCAHPHRAALVLRYLTNPVILFHQVYSGQLDLIPAYFFLLYLVAISERSGFLASRALCALSGSLAVKPFAILYAPMVAMGDAPRPQVLARELCRWALAIIVSVALSFPWLTTSAYRAQLGQSASLLAQGNLVFRPFMFFAALAGLVVAWPRLAHRWPQRIQAASFVLLATLVCGATTAHSAGWMVWAVVGLLGVQLNDPAQRVSLPTSAWRLFYGFFVARWALVDHSPCFFSAGVFVRSFVDRSFVPELGSIFRAIERHVGVDAAHALVWATDLGFSLACVLLLVAMVRALHKGACTTEQRCVTKPLASPPKAA